MTRMTRMLSGVALVCGAGLSSAAMAQQPLSLVVQPVTAAARAPFQIVDGLLGGVGSPGIVRAPFQAVDGLLGGGRAAPEGGYNEAPARRAATGYTNYNWAVVQPGVLRETGPRYANPANADYRRPVVLRRGSIVPGYVNTAPVANISTPGMYANARYDFFVTPQQRVVFLHPSTRQVVQIR